MSETHATDVVEKAIETASAAWTEAHRGLPANPMTRTAAIPAIGIIAASILTRFADGEDDAAAAAVEAIATARQAWERSSLEIPSNPMAKTAEKAAIGIIAAGILNASVRT
jgi:hypothetical protein